MNIVTNTFYGALALMIGGMSHAQAQPPAPTPAEQAATTLHLLEGGRFSEAIPAAQTLVELAPNDAVSYQIRGTIGLYIGSPGAAQADFANAAKLADTAVTQYGQALSNLVGKRTSDAESVLTALRATPDLPASQAADTDTLLAYLKYLNGDYAGALALSGSSAPADDAMRQELQALIAAHTQPEQGLTLLSAFLTRPSGVPQVVEDIGVRPLFETAAASVEPSVTEPTLQAMYRTSFAGAVTRSAHQAQSAQHLSGDVTLVPPSGAGSDAAMVAYYSDGQMVGLVNTPPYSQTWHTATVGNGWHTVRTDLLDASGSVIATSSHRVSVLNENGAGPDAGLSADGTLEMRVWNALRLRPSRKVAEWTLANLLDRQGNHTSAGAHRAVAAALDANYKDARRVARSVFGGSVAALRAVSNAQPQGLSIGSTSRRQVALTFDDGPNPLKTPSLLDALDKADAPATFFVVGSRAEAAPDLVRRMAARGDDVEDHSYTHPNMAQSPPAVAEAEILRASVIIRALTQRQPRFFRPPGGNRNPVVYHLSHEYGQTVALWTVDALHFEESGSSQSLIAYVMAHVQPGCIVLMHNGMDTTTAAIPGLIAALRARGYEPVTLTQLTSTAAPSRAAFVRKPRPVIP